MTVADHPSLPECSVEQLLQRLTALDVRVAADGARLRYDAPSHVVEAELLAALRRHKPALLARLGGTDSRVVARAPTTVLQERMIQGHQRNPLPQVYNVGLRITLNGQLHVDTLRSALEQLIRRHYALRCRFPQGAGAGWQEVLPPRPVALPVEDLRKLPRGRRRRRARKMCAATAAVPFDLADGVQPVARLLRTDDAEWMLLLVFHHISCDGWSVSVMLREFTELYRAAIAGVTATLPAPSMQCTDYAFWQRAHADSPAEKQRKLAFWARRLQGAVPVDLPLDRPRPEEPTGRGRVAEFSLDADTRDAVEGVARRRGVTPFAVATAGLAVLLSALGGQSDIALRVANANRDHSALDSLVACTASGFLLRLSLDPATSFGDLVDQVSCQTWEAMDHMMLLADIVDGVREHHGLRIPERFPVSMAYENSLDMTLALPGLQATVTDETVPAARMDFAFGIVPTSDGLTGFVEHSLDLWEPATIDTWLRDYQSTLVRSCGEPERPLLLG